MHPDNPSEDALRSAATVLRAALRVSGFGVKAAHAVLGQPLPSGAACCADQQGKPSNRSAADLAIAMWLCGREADDQAVIAALGQDVTHDLLEHGLLTRLDSQCLAASMQVYPLSTSDLSLRATVAELWVATDWPSQSQAEPGTMPIASEDLELAADAPCYHVNSLLNLRCGCGVHALLAAAYGTTVLATDASARAARYCGLNAMLNGLEARLEVCHGHGYDPAAARTFDAILCTQPCELMAAGAAGRDMMAGATAGAADGEADEKRDLRWVMRGAPAHLKPRGFIITSCELDMESSELGDCSAHLTLSRCAGPAHSLAVAVVRRRPMPCDVSDGSAGEADERMVVDSRGRESAIVVGVLCERPLGGGPLAGRVQLINFDTDRRSGRLPRAAYACLRCMLGLVGLDEAADDARVDAEEGTAAADPRARGTVPSALPCHDPPPWALIDAAGKTLLSLCVRTADGAAQPIVPRGGGLPSLGRLLLTTSAHGVSSLDLELLIGTRPAAVACKPIANLRIPIGIASRGLAQVRSPQASWHASPRLHLLLWLACLGLTCRSSCPTVHQPSHLSSTRRCDLHPMQTQVLIEARLGRSSLLVFAVDVQTGRSQSLVLEGPAAEAAAEVAAERAAEAAAETAARQAQRRATLPVPWRYATAYTEQPHPGFCCAGGRYIALPAESGGADVPSERRVASDGEVAPEATAARVWPGAHLLACYLQGSYLQGSHTPGAAREHSSPPTVGKLEGARVIELGAGLGVPGLAAWTLGATEVLLTDLPENLPRLEASVARNGAQGAVRVAPLDWLAPLPPQLVRTRWDVVVAADCVFWVRLFEPLLATLRGLAEAGGGPAPLILVTVTSRLNRGALFEEALARHRWVAEELASGQGEGFAHTRLLRLQPAPEASAQTGAEDTGATLAK